MGWRFLLTRKSFLRADDMERIVVEPGTYVAGIRRNFLHFELLSLPSSKAQHRRRRRTGKN